MVIYVVSQLYRNALSQSQIQTEIEEHFADHFCARLSYAFFICKGNNQNNAKVRLKNERVIQ